MTGVIQALLMSANASLPGTTLWYVGPTSGEVGGASAANSGSLGGTLTRASLAHGSIVATGIDTTGPASTPNSWVSSGSSVPGSTSGVGEIFELWMRNYSTLSSPQSVATEIIDTSSAQGFFVELGGGNGANSRLVARVSGTLLYTVTSALYKNTWFHAAISKDPSNNCTLYLNGVSVATIVRGKTLGGHQLQLSQTGSGTDTTEVANVRYRTGYYYASNFSPPTRT